MAFEHYKIVRDSDLYEYRGLTKSVLMTIAMLIRQEPEEDERGKIRGERHPNTGWCDAGEEYLAAALGSSTATISNHVTTIKADGWLEVETWRNSLGHLHNKYRFADGKQEEVKARAYKKDEAGNFVRGKETTKARKGPRGEKGRFLTAKRREAANGLPAGNTRQALPLLQVAEEPNGKLQTGLTASCSRPHGKLQQVVGLSRLSEQVDEHVDKKQFDHPGADKTKDKTKTNPNTVSGTEFASLLGAEDVPPVDKPRGVAPNPTEASRLETPGISVSPVGDSPIPPPPVPEVVVHYSHKMMKSGKGKVCRFCICHTQGRFEMLPLPCKPNIEWKEEARLWREHYESQAEGAAV